MNKPDPARVRVLTLNLWALAGDWEQRRQVIRDGIAAMNPDLIAFIEAVKTAEYDQARDVIADGYHLAYQEARESDGQGATIASRWPVRVLHEVDQRVSGDATGFAPTTLVAEIDAPEPFGDLVFANHVPNWQLDFEWARERQALTAARFLENLRPDHGRHVVVAGDFTADPDCASVRFFSGRQSLDGMSVAYRDAWLAVHPEAPGHTFVPENPLVADWDWPLRRLDYVFVRCGLHGGPTLRVDRCDVVFDKPVDGVWASDHFGVIADLVPPPSRTFG